MFYLMGRFLEDVPSKQLSAGNICALSLMEDDSNYIKAVNEGGICSLDRHVTLSNAPNCPIFRSPYTDSRAAIVRVSIQPLHLSDFVSLQNGLKLLYFVDPSVEMSVKSETGELVLGCAGTLHLQKCLQDLKQIFLKDIPFSVSEPLVACRETITDNLAHVKPPCPPPGAPGGQILPFPPWTTVPETIKTDTLIASDGSVTESSANGSVTLSVRARSMPATVFQWIEENADDLMIVLHKHTSSLKFLKEDETTGGREYFKCLKNISETVESLLSEVWEESARYRVVGMSVQRGSRNILLYEGDDYDWRIQHSYAAGEDTCGPGGIRTSNILPPLVSGFTIASCSGPICEEPIIGVIFIITKIRIENNETVKSADECTGGVSELGSVSDSYGPLSVQTMSLMRDVCRKAVFQRGRCRLVEALLKIELVCEQSALGGAYGVLSKRRAKILSEDMREGTSLFVIEALIPVIESFDLSEALRGKSSGGATLHLQFSHFEILDDEPFIEYTMTPKELEELGDQGMLVENISRKVVNSIRKRKGLNTGQKIMSGAEKQRTLKR
eukprot:GHVL01005405.1.p1 GENE.GHVL01005405.1~~GHVL01005405.1.p1  ORF type:complete len:557 (+),score=124.83 GHVL01005405.1:308-1978(+)